MVRVPSRRIHFPSLEQVLQQAWPESVPRAAIAIQGSRALLNSARIKFPYKSSAEVGHRKVANQFLSGFLLFL
jgi:hypothetical protein